MCTGPDAGLLEYLASLGCQDDFERLASEPLDASIPGARSVKFVIDLSDDNALYFQNSVQYPIHWEFVSAHLSVGQGKALVGPLSEFNSEYTSATRRFLLGAITYYQGAKVWALEFAPYDTATAAQMELAYRSVAAHAFFGEELRLHPTSLSSAEVAEELASDVLRVTTGELLGGSDYQPLNLAESYGRLTFVTADELDDEFVTFRDVVVLDHVPNDISVTQGIITSEFQTPLAHINVLSQNRGTPNMALRGAFDDPELRALEGRWVRLEVGPFDFHLEEVDKAEADVWWDAHRPQAVSVPGADLETRDLRDIQATTQVEETQTGAELLAAIKEGTRAFGGKAANFGAMSHIAGLPVPKAFAVPIYYYFQFMQQNGFDQRVDALLADSSFTDDPAVRDAELKQLRDDMRAAPVDSEFEAMLLDKLAAEYPATRMRFRSSTNAEDLDGFTGAGLYTSRSGDPDDPDYPVLDAIRRVWSSVWYFRAFEERSYRSIDHRQVGMALLVHRSFPDEDANGVALTNNPFDKSGLEPAFYVNVQKGEVSVVLPPVGVTTESFLYYHSQEGQPTTYLSRSNLVGDGDLVLSRRQVHDLGVALQAIQRFFAPAYGPGLGSNSWWAMDVEFKFDSTGAQESELFIKQARPFGNR